MGSLHVHHLTCAHITRLRINGNPLICHVLLIETPSDGLVLVDTGLGTSDYAAIASRLGWGFAYGYARPEVAPALAAIRQIEAMGFDPHDVRHIVQTHLDLDHVGGLSDFPWATVHVHAAELEAAQRRKGIRARGRYRPKMWEHNPRWQTYTDPGEPWLGFEAVRELLGLPGEIVLIPLPGHTVGHCGVVLDSDRGVLLHAGDAFFDPRQLDRQPQCARGVALFQAVVTTDRRLRDLNQARLRDLVATHPEIEVFAAHDPGYRVPART